MVAKSGRLCMREIVSEISASHELFRIILNDCFDTKRKKARLVSKDIQLFVKAQLCKGY